MASRPQGGQAGAEVLETQVLETQVLETQVLETQVLETQVMITVKDVIDFGNRWFETVGRGGSAQDQAAFFRDPHALIYVIWNGVTFSLEQHYQLHTQWINERHEFGHFAVMPLNASPERVRATGTVYWQVECKGRPAPNVIKAVVGEDWILERTPSGEITFVLYLNTFHHTLPDSAPLVL